MGTEAGSRRCDGALALQKGAPEVLDWEADERAAEPKRPATTSKDEVIRTDYEARARQMLIIARSNSGGGG
jgi:hypothetical protein